MKILGNRVLVSKIEETKVEGAYETVKVTDSFVYMGKVELRGDAVEERSESPGVSKFIVDVGDTIYFAKYSPDTQDIEHEGKKYKVVRVEDILAVL